MSALLRGEGSLVPVIFPGAVSLRVVYLQQRNTITYLHSRVVCTASQDFQWDNKSKFRQSLPSFWLYLFEWAHGFHHDVSPG